MSWVVQWSGVRTSPPKSQNRSQRRRSDQQPQPTLPHRSGSGTGAPPPQRGRRLLPAAAGAGAGVRDAGVDKGGSAHDVDLGGGLDVVHVERLAPVGGRVGVHGHCVCEAGVAGRQAARGQVDAQGQVVDVAVGRGAGVCDGVGEAVVFVVLLRVGRLARDRGVLQARGVVGDVVGEEARVGLAHLRVLAVVVVLAGAGGAEGLREGGHEGGAGGEGGGTGGVEDGGDGGEGAGGVEKGHGVLEEEAEGHAGDESVVVHHGAEEGGTAGLGVIGAKASVKSPWE